MHNSKTAKEPLKRSVHTQNCTAPEDKLGSSSEEEEETSTLYTTNDEVVEHSTSALLLTGLATVRNEKTNEVREIECLLDTGADKSFIDQQLADELQLPTLGKIDLSVYTFGSKTPKRQMYETTKLRIWDLQGNPHELSLCKTKVITGKRKRVCLTEQDAHYLREKKILLSKQSVALSVLKSS
ncbi:hypothetical protein COOONC_17376 [Cooperia oncophora]